MPYPKKWIAGVGISLHDAYTDPTTTTQKVIELLMHDGIHVNFAHKHIDASTAREPAAELLRLAALLEDGSQ